MSKLPEYRRIVSQLFLPDGVLTEFENGDKEMQDYLKDEDGNDYVELWPNDHLDAQMN